MMNKLFARRFLLLALIMTLALSVLFSSAPITDAADHGDAPTASNDQQTDIADVYLYLDPTNNSRVIIAATFRGFIVPSEAVNFGAFEPSVRYGFNLETTGDAIPDHFIDVRFSQRTSTTTPQTATVILPFGQVITAPTTVSTLADNPNPFTVTTDPSTGVSVFAGVVDDPFFFDIPGFNRFVASVLSGAPNGALLQRGRDSFAGYNVQSIALSIPISYLKLQNTAGNPTGSEIGVNFVTQRQRRTVIGRDGSVNATGGFMTIDRMGVPAINVALIPFSRKDEYNNGIPQDDAAGRFANSIVGTLQALGTNSTNIGILASVAVARGDFLRLNINTPNSGPGGGNNANAGFPNGRRLGDDVIDTILFFVANQNTLSDNANANDVPRTDSFPFFGLPQQPRTSGTDDNTRN
jgi:hypothetical protein